MNLQFILSRKIKDTWEANALSSAKVSCAGYHGSFFKQMVRSL
jgi:hypothetical protein